jgi:hypothetical protein
MSIRDLQSARRSAVRDALRLPREAARLRGELQSLNRAIVESIDKGAEERPGGGPSDRLSRT